MSAIASTPGALRLLIISIVARLPLTMLSIGLLLQVQHLRGSFAVAGLVTGVYAMSVALGEPLLGRLVDRRGQTVVLLASSSAAGNAAALAGVLLLAGAAIAPTYGAIYAIVDRVAPAGTLTEAFAWLTTALAIGGAIGAALAGAVAADAGADAAFALAGCSGVLALLTTIARVRTLAAPERHGGHAGAWEPRPVAATG